MCTLTYLPLQNNKFILTTNRDESPKRKTSAFPQIEDIGGHKIMFPKDDVAGGTWVAVSDSGKIACLLNGAFKAHKHQPPYRKSRGLILLESLNYEDSYQFFREVDLNNIEPFTLLIIETKTQLFFEFRWDGVSKYEKRVESENPGIWSSAMLYPPEVRKKREKWFQRWLSENPNFELNNIRKFHHEAGEDNERERLLMNSENQVKTVSITSILPDKRAFLMIYEDLVSNSYAEVNLELRY